MTFTAEELAACAEREVRQRRKAYPRWIAAGHMTQAFADQQTAMMEAIARQLRQKADDEAAQGKLF